MATTVWGRAVSAVRAGASAFMDALQAPDGAQNQLDADSVVSQVDYRWAWYTGALFMSRFGPDVITRYLLYAETRIGWSPVQEIVDFWAGIVYPGELTDGADSAIPLSKDTPEALKVAIDQVWEWGNWPTNKSVLERHVAAIGYSMVIIKDDVEAGEVYPELQWASHVKEIDINKKGDVKGYTLEYPVIEADEQGKPQKYIYREVVDKGWYRTYRGTNAGDMQPYDISPDQTRGFEWRNPYGFVPAVWRRFRSDGGTFGPSCMGNAYGELAAINSLESHMDDQVHKSIDPKTIIWSGGGLHRMLSRKAKEFAAGKEGSATTSVTGLDLAESARNRQAMDYFEGPVGGKIDQISGTGNLADALAFLQHKKEAFKDRFPEFTMYPKLREMTQVTGPAAEILLGDTKHKVVEVRGDADRQTKKLAQMCVAIAGWRLKEGKGGWSKKTAAQMKFASFDLGSYDRGELDFKIEGRHFIPDAPLTEQERVAIANVKMNQLDIPEEQVWEELDYDQDKIKAWKKAQDELRIKLASVPPPMPAKETNAQGKVVAASKANEPVVDPDSWR